MKTLAPALALCVCIGLPASAQELMALLDQGAVVMVKNGDDGRFESATSVLFTQTAPKVVWGVIRDFSKYVEFMPRVILSEVHKTKKPNVFDVDFEIEVPGPNPDYTLRYQVNDARMQAVSRWKKGDLEGTYSRWRLVPHKAGTLIYFTTSSKNFSSMAKALEDENQTITIGVNVTAALVSIRAVRRRAEAMAAANEPSAPKREE